MKQILQNLKSGETKAVSVPTPSCGRGKVLIKTSRTLISAGTERMLVEFSKGGLLSKAISQPDKAKQVLDKIKTEGLMPTIETVFMRLDEPLSLGYCNVGTVIQAESSSLNTQSFKKGDRVASNGPHAEMVCVSENLCAKIPDNVSDEEAAFAVLGAIGLQGIRLAKPTLGEKFVVFGTGLIGLLTVQLLRASGCEVFAIDLNEERLELAQSWGADICNSGQADPVQTARAWSQNNGVDGVIITASAKTDEIVHQSAKICRKRGRIVLVGSVGLNLRRDDFYEKELSFQVSCSYGPGRYDSDYEEKGHDYPIGYVRWTEQRNFQAVLSMMASGRLDVSPLITDRFDFEDAPKAYEKISKDPSALGVILEYKHGAKREEDTYSRLDRTIRVNKYVESSGGCVAAMIGAGNFAKMTLGPALSKTEARLKYVSARTDVASASHIAGKYGFEFATTDLEEILSDSQVNTIFIATGHNSHAALCQKAIQAGKHVFVEKPLCLTLEELEEIQQCYYSANSQPGVVKPKRDEAGSSSLLLTIGFNRRFSPHSVKIKELLANRSEPLAMNFTVNAGIIPPDVWVHDPEIGGGRIIGEACHFIDLLSFISGRKIVSVASAMMGGGVAVKQDKMSIALTFEDGSIGTVNYFGNGSKAYPKESLEIFSEGRVLRLDNFNKLIGYGFKGFRKFKTSRLDKGHQTQFNALVKRVSEGGPPLIPFDEIVNVTLASFAAVKSANENRTIVLNEEYPEVIRIAHTGEMK